LVPVVGYAEQGNKLLDSYGIGRIFFIGSAAVSFSIWTLLGELNIFDNYLMYNQHLVFYYFKNGGILCGMFPSNGRYSGGYTSV
jgi:hypothetical protein